MHLSGWRQAVILAGNDLWLTQQLTKILTQFAEKKENNLIDCQIAYCGEIGLKHAFPSLLIHSYHFKQSKNLLGQEFELAILDYRSPVKQQLILHLESLAILGATLKANGYLILLLPEWDKIENYSDQDSLRWNNATQPLVPLQFYQWFKKSLSPFLASTSIRLYQQHTKNEISLDFSSTRWQIPKFALKEQQHILQQLIQAKQDIYLLTAARGRGKSAVSGLLAEQLAQANITVYLTAPNRQAIKTLLKHCPQQPPIFLAPDQLRTEIDQTPAKFTQAWLIVDEAAMLPLEILLEFSQTFVHILFTTTVDGYEGTGKGFSLKLAQQLQRPSQRLQLNFPLRWQEHDPLEKWINQLLLLHTPQQSSTNTTDKEYFLPLTQGEFSQNSTVFQQLYSLLTIAHYRTTPLDLRRLLDAKDQYFYQLQSNQQLSGIIWGVTEGKLDLTLIEQIRTGYRQPAGNLLVQALCFQANLPLACQLKSLRISRIAITPNLQQRGSGSRLLQHFLTDISLQTDFDFISVSFGYQPRLANFWFKNGFQLVHLTHRQEASSGYYSTMAIYPLSKQGKRFCQQATRQFKRNFLLSDHHLITEICQQLKWQIRSLEWHLTTDDWQSLSDFALHHRTFNACYPALQRYLKQYPNPTLATQLSAFIRQKQYKKNALITLKQSVKADLLRKGKLFYITNSN
ncbi:tRNA cytosine(34) acetyltransferase TmcA [Mergibacter septicus]|uniref:tRNA(Met) cytidine acetyltransferase TmcA n=1 Tax=Mergibacter septicus TaxID=221402 RepID=A0A8D4IX42_9PAST|nr:GNAT family N-acetyltransferase [Mergibacter septicus]AWX15009.1 tRNA cytosine(34) acetyltransferase TmcA [Mergibacter septicus]QDJ14261.1 tRNA cytosine(34) acetyltransferase TmcA [Mergibacter septicus]UTU48294.1 tRNA(Met) cytidine acetyltransferase [Mergibacter septicus]WMR96084.1 GNAT family N-acetyltransferase [Mergibacter septicus]